ncbi:MAG: flagellar hook-length control protein FliK, partial [Bacteroidales bacterium]|nr:flagellar hook-length control protein FliK [Bacteroidales bacterium]
SNFKDQMQEIIKNAKVYVKDSKNGSFTVKLNPKELGNVNVNLGLENGTLHGKFLVENEGAKQLLMSNIENFIQQLKDAGVDVGSFDVDVKDNKEQLFQDNDENKMLFSQNQDDQSKVAMEYNDNSSLSHIGSINMVI